MLDIKNLGPLDYARILWNRKWYFIITSVVITGAVTWFAWQLPHIYQSQARIQAQAAFALEESGAMASRDRTDDRINAIRELVQSRAFIEKMIEEFDMMRSAGGGATLEDMVNAVRDKIKITTVSSSVFILSYTSPNPQFARDMVQKLAERLIEENKEIRQTRAQGADEFFEEQVRKASAALQAQEEKITSFKNDHLGELPEQSSAIMNALSAHQSQLISTENSLQAARERQRLIEFQIAERSRVDTLQDSLTASQETHQSQAQAPARQASALANQLAAKQAELSIAEAKYKETHPDRIRLAREVQELQRRVDEENRAAGTPVATVQQTQPATPARPSPNQGQTTSTSQLKFELENLKTEIAQREKDRQELTQQIKTYQQRLNMGPALAQELMGMNRELDRLKTQHDNLQSRKFNAEMSASLLIDRKNDIYKIIDQADLPQRPIAPNRAQIALIGLAAGIALGLGAVFGREYLDPTLGTAEEAAAALSLPILISIPEISGDAHPKRGKLLAGKSPAR